MARFDDLRLPPQLHPLFGKALEVSGLLVGGLVIGGLYAVAKVHDALTGK